MNLSIGTIQLEEVEFAQKPDYVAAPGTPQPNSTVDLRVELARLSEGYGGVVRLRCSSDTPGVAHRFKVSYAAILTLDLQGEEPPADLDKRLMVTGGSMLLPFVRELISNLSARTPHGSTWIAPTDFNRMVADSEAKALTAAP